MVREDAQFVPVLTPTESMVVLYAARHRVRVPSLARWLLALGISDQIPESRHDDHCLGESGVLLSADRATGSAIKGYVGNNMIIPFRKPKAASS